MNGHHQQGRFVCLNTIVFSGVFFADGDPMGFITIQSHHLGGHTFGSPKIHQHRRVAKIQVEESQDDETFSPCFDLGVSKNRGTPKSSILIGFSIINHPFLGTPIFGNTHFLRCFQFPDVQTQTRGRAPGSNFNGALRAGAFTVMSLGGHC